MLSAASGPSAATESSLSGENSAGENLGGANLGGANLGGANLGGANLAGANLGGANLGGANLGANNVSVLDEIGDTLIVGNFLSGSPIPSPQTLFTSQLRGTSATTSNLTGCPVSGSYRLGSPSDTTLYSSTSNIAKSIHAATYAAPTGLLRSAEELRDKAVSGASCIVLGLGSTAMARLVVQNTAANPATGYAPMYAGLAATPWTFRSPVDAARSLKVWELVVWGPNRYSVFLIVSPTTSSWEGVAGYVKAVFRWNAPLGMPLKIFAIGGGKTVQTHTGMMNASKHFVDNTITDTTYVAGLLAFVTATTNTTSVAVDFTSWVVTRAGNILVLGNVDPSASLYWNEGQYVAFHTSPNAYNTNSINLSDREVGIYPVSNMSESYPSMYDLYSAYFNWYNGYSATKPIAKRCMGALMLNQFYFEPIPVGKCDAIAMNGYKHFPTGGQSVQIKTKPYKLDAYTASPVLPYNSRQSVPTELWPYNYSTNTWNYLATALSATYIYLNEAPY